MYLGTADYSDIYVGIQYSMFSLKCYSNTISCFVQKQFRITWNEETKNKQTRYYQNQPVPKQEKIEVLFSYLKNLGIGLRRATMHRTPYWRSLTLMRIITRGFLCLLAYLRAKVHKYISNYKDISGTLHLLRGKVINNLIPILFVRQQEDTLVIFGMRYLL